MPDKSKMEEIAPGLYKASERSFYVEHDGKLKFVIKERLDKLVERDGSYENVVKNYRVRQHGAKKESDKADPKKDVATAPSKELVEV